MNIEIIPVGFLQANCYIVSDDNGVAAVIDPGDEPEKILRYLDDNRLTCTTVLITHGHFDHVGGVTSILKATGAKLAISKLDKISVNDNIDIYIEDGMSINVGDMIFSVIEVPGHSPGSVCYLMGDSLFTGDTLFFETVGRTDIPRANPISLAKSLLRIRDLPYDDLNIFPGHMQTTTLRHERDHNIYLK